MRRKNKSNKLIRYLAVFKKRLKKVTLQKIYLWINKNLKGHPFILGFLTLIWFSYVIHLLFEIKDTMGLLKFHLKFHTTLFSVWLVLVILSNFLRDREKIKWYFKKSFVFIMLVLLTPIGLILLWTGSRFKRITKIIFTIIFVFYFIVGSVYQEKKQQKFLNMSPFERITEMITKRKSRVFLKSASLSLLSNFKFINIPDKQKVKRAVSQIYSQYSPSIVSIKTFDKSDRELGFGSGFIISKGGLIVTNYHVIESAHKAEVKIGDNVFKDVYLVKSLPNFDIAILKIEAEGFLPLVIGDSDNLTSGQFIIALGNPLGFEQSVSSGIISAIRLNHNMKLIQMTVPVSLGSSGGPVLNEYGEVIGITTIGTFFFAQNLNFAIPINYLKKIIIEQK